MATATLEELDVRYALRGDRIVRVLDAEWGTPDFEGRKEIRCLIQDAETVSLRMCDISELRKLPDAARVVIPLIVAASKAIRANQEFLRALGVVHGRRADESEQGKDADV